MTTPKGSDRLCPKCRTPFHSVQDLGVCPRCRVWFSASRPLWNEYIGRLTRGVFWTVAILVVILNVAFRAAGQSTRSSASEPSSKWSNILFIGSSIYGFPGNRVTSQLPTPTVRASRESRNLLATVASYGISAVFWATLVTLVVWLVVTQRAKRRITVGGD